MSCDSGADTAVVVSKKVELVAAGPVPDRDRLHTLNPCMSTMRALPHVDHKG
jgi:hypothetical protein